MRVRNFMTSHREPTLHRIRDSATPHANIRGVSTGIVRSCGVFREMDISPAMYRQLAIGTCKVTVISQRGTGVYAIWTIGIVRKGLESVNFACERWPAGK